MSKGQRTRVAIVEAALEQASATGLEGLTIGALAERMKMSKSGVFAHFGSREELQISVIREYHERFEEEVFRAAMRQPRGLPATGRRLRAHEFRQRRPSATMARQACAASPPRACCAPRWARRSRTA